MSREATASDFQRIFQAAPDLYLILQPDLTIVAASDAYLRATMTRREDVLGRPLFEVFPDNPTDSAATGVANLRASLKRVLSEKRPDAMADQKYDVRRPRHEGGGFEVRYWRPMNFPVLGESGDVEFILHRVEDVTEIVRLGNRGTEQERTMTLQELAERLASAVDTIQDAFAIFDAQDRLVLCNSVYRRLLAEWISGPLVGRKYEDLLLAWIQSLEFSDERSREHFRVDRLEKRRSELASTFDVRTRDGRSLRVTDRRTAEGGIVKTIWDLTEDVRREDELREARAAADAASRAKSDFLSSMSHELRTPMNAILGFAQLLQRDKKEPLSSRHRERVEQILAGGEHLLRLIDDILDLSRIEAGGISISVEPANVPDVLAEVQRTLQSMAARQGIRLDVVPVPSTLPPVLVDYTRFTQILMNFGSNAIKYNRPRGRVTFVAAQQTPDRVRVTVQDTGLGLSLEQQRKLFQPFQRLGQETGPIEGTGIGLVITRRLAELMGAAVGVESVPGEGSAFWVDVRAHVAPVEADARTVPRREAPRSLSDGKRRVLYVEDNPANVTFMRDLMGAFENIELLVAADAEVGIAMAEEHLPAAIIMDINLPGMSGLDALKALRARLATQAIPVIALTAAASERDKLRGVQAGFHRYLTKPVRVDELLHTLEDVLKRGSDGPAPG